MRELNVNEMEMVNGGGPVGSRDGHYRSIGYAMFGAVAGSGAGWASGRIAGLAIGAAWGGPVGMAIGALVGVGITLATTR